MHTTLELQRCYREVLTFGAVFKDKKQFVEEENIAALLN